MPPFFKGGITWKQSKNEDLTKSIIHGTVLFAGYAYSEMKVHISNFSYPKFSESHYY